jgi:hypothetical protein
MDDDHYGSCAHCGEPAYAYEGATIYECVHCLVRWCEKCELALKDHHPCLFCGKDFYDQKWIHSSIIGFSPADSAELLHGPATRSYRILYN